MTETRWYNSYMWQLPQSTFKLQFDLFTVAFSRGAFVSTVEPTNDKLSCVGRVGVEGTIRQLIEMCSSVSVRNTRRLDTSYIKLQLAVLKV
jgi:hypothetical protein